MPLARFQRTVTDAAGNVVPNAPFEVRVKSTGNLAAIYDNRAGSSGILNPGTADADGMIAFHAIGAAYEITVTVDGDTIVWDYVGIGTAQESDIPLGGYVSRLVTAAGAADVDPGDVMLLIKKTVGAATTVNLPPVADRNGVPVVIKDAKGDANSNPITPVFDGAELADGLAGSAYQITTPYGWVRFDPLPDNSGWAVIGSQL